MPVYGPIEYKGRPLGLDIKIIEIDAEDKQAFAIFKTIAAFGAKAYAPAAPVLAVLEGIGASLVSAGTDDTQWRYTMVLDPSGGFSGNIYATLEAGDYVFIREEARQSTTPWDKLLYDHNTGRLWVGPREAAQPYTDNSYLTVQILKNAGSEDITLEQNTFGPFRDALEKESNTKVEEFQKHVTPQLLKLGESRVRARNFNHAQRLYEGILADNKSGTEERAANKAFELCQSLLEAAKSLNDPKTKDTANLDPEQVEFLLRRIRTNAKLKDADQIGKFTLSGFVNVTTKECMAVALPKSDTKPTT
jgi:hypothetical protein